MKLGSNLHRTVAHGGFVLTLMAIVNTVDVPGTVPYFARISGERGIPDMHPFASAGALHAILTALGPEGRRMYGVELATFDLIFPAAVAFFLLSAIALASGARPSPSLRMVALAGPVLDYVENAACAVLLAKYPHEPASIASLVGYVTAAKFFAYGAGVLAIPLSRASRRWNHRGSLNRARS